MLTQQEIYDYKLPYTNSRWDDSVKEMETFPKCVNCKCALHHEIISDNFGIRELAYLDNDTDYEIPHCSNRSECKEFAEIILDERLWEKEKEEKKNANIA